MTFDVQEVANFETFVKPFLPQIRNTAGCTFLQLLRVKNTPNQLMTISHWESAEALENYRNSELFKVVWATTKLHFSDKPEAYSLESIETLT